MGRTRHGRTLEFGIVYDPLPSQLKFHDSSARFKGFSGPIGSGKSQALCHEAIRLAFENPGRMGLIGAPTYPILRDSTQRAVLEVLEDNDLVYDFNKSTNEVTLKYAESKIALSVRSESESHRIFQMLLNSPVLKVSGLFVLWHNRHRSSRSKAHRYQA